jgi:tRNA(adenine34) deaminase
MDHSCHVPYMRLCLELAETARKRGEVPVGAVILREGSVIAEGIEGVRTHHEIARHAEMEAIQRACQLLQTRDLSGCTLYSSAEPCFMCSYAIRACKISRVVFGAPIDTIGGVSSRFPLLTTSDVPGWGDAPEVIQGILREECEAQRAAGLHELQL